METRLLDCRLTRAAGGGDEAEVTITTPDQDLMGDCIDPLGMATDTYLKGPRAVNFAHDHSRLPVARTLALNTATQGIRARFRWRTDATSQEVRAAFDDGVLGASVEFIVPEGGAVPNGKGYHFTKTILTGWALTGNPANPRCVKMFRSLGLWRGGDELVRLPDIPAERPVSDLEKVVAMRRTVRAAVGEALAQRVADVVRQKVRGDAPYLTITDSPATGAARAMRHHVGNDPVLRVAGMTDHEVRRQVAEITKTALSDAITAAVSTAIRRARGRVD
jgi:hypothetical protein